MLSSYPMYPVLGGLVRSVARRKVERVQALAGVSAVASAAYQQHLHEIERPEFHADAPHAAPLTGTNPLLAPETAALLQSLHSLDAHLMVRVMVAAARADGAIDAEERQRMLGHLKDVQGTAEDREYLLAEMESPHGLDDIADQVPDPEQALELYSAALIAIDVDTPSERHFLADLARRLSLDPGRVAELHAVLGEPAPDLAPPAGEAS